MAGPAGGRERRPGRPGGRTRPAAALRLAYRRRLLHLAARDLTGAMAIDEVAAELADLAAAALEAALAIARSQLPAGAAPCRLAVIAMGKCGGRELNYASDVDVIFVAEPAEGGAGRRRTGPALRTATQLAAGMIRVCSQSTPRGGPVPGRPEPASRGPRRPAGPDAGQPPGLLRALGEDLGVPGAAQGPAGGGRSRRSAAPTRRRITPLVWQAAQRENFVADVQAMRRRVIGTLPAGRPAASSSSVPAGCATSSSPCSCCSSCTAAADETLRSPATLPALAALADGGYVGRDDAASLAAAYRFLRWVEHLLQLRQLRRTHTLPDDPAVLRRIGRAHATAEAGAAAAAAPPIPRRRGPTRPRSCIAAWRQHAARSGGCTRSCSTGRCWTRWRGCPARRPG